MKKHYDHIYLSPHLDDAMFSCGSIISKQREQVESVLILTVFAGVPEKSLELSASIISFIKKSGYDSVTNFCKARCIEDKNACNFLNVEYKHLKFLDCIYRTGKSGTILYKNFSEIFSSNPASQDVTVKELYSSIQSILVNASNVYCPLPINGHIDHVLTNNVGEMLVKKGCDVFFYEDIYTLDHDVSLFLKENKPRLKSQILIKVKKEDISNHKKAIQCYKSQLNGLLAHTKMSTNEIVSFLNHCDNEKPYQRLWSY